MAKNITAYSSPDHDVPYWPLDSYWNCADWKLWHQLMVEEFGLQEANSRFLSEWNNQYLGSWEYSLCKYNSNFTTYFKSVGLDPGNFISDTINNTKDTVVNVSKGAKDVSELINNRFGAGLLLLGAGYLAYKFFFD